MTKFGILVVVGVALAGAVFLTGVRTRIGPPVRVVPVIVHLRLGRAVWDTSAKSIALMAVGGPWLYRRNAEVERPIASVTKTMTAYLVLTHPAVYPLNRVITITPSEVVNDRRGLLKADSEVPLRVGQKVTVRDLLYALMLPSADDGAWTLADNYPGGSRAFIQAMNQKAQVLGMNHTHFVDPDGVNHLGYSTAADLMKLLQRDMALKEFRTLVTSKTANTRFGRLVNLNQLLWTYPGTIGIKTGWTPWAGSCLAFAATRKFDGHPLTIEGVVLGEPSFGPMFQDVTNLLNTGFDSVRYQTVLPRGATIATVAMKTGWLERPRQVRLVLKRALGVFATRARAKIMVRWTGPERGYHAGERVGTVYVQEAGWRTASAAVIAESTLTVPWWKRL